MKRPPRRGLLNHPLGPPRPGVVTVIGLSALDGIILMSAVFLICLAALTHGERVAAASQAAPVAADRAQGAPAAQTARASTPQARADGACKRQTWPYRTAECSQHGRGASRQVRVVALDGTAPATITTPAPTIEPKVARAAPAPRDAQSAARPAVEPPAVAAPQIQPAVAGVPVHAEASAGDEERAAARARAAERKARRAQARAARHAQRAAQASEERRATHARSIRRGNESPASAERDRAFAGGGFGGFMGSDQRGPFGGPPGASSHAPAPFGFAPRF